MSLRELEFNELKRAFSSVQSLSCVQLFATPWIAARQVSLSIINSWSSLTLTSIESVMPSSHLILCRPLLLLPPTLPASPSFPMSQLFAWGGQSTGVWALASFLPKKYSKAETPKQPEDRIWIDLLSKDLLRANRHMKRGSNITSHQGNANQNYNEISSHTGQNGCYLRQQNSKC